jgi:dihydrodipicolinate synthase/N-acetylneuraminate lyase
VKLALRGVIAALVTPLDERGQLDENALERLLAHVVGAGADGVSPAGSTGEGARLTRRQRLRLAARVRALVPNRLPVLPGVPLTSVEEGIAELAELADLGVTAALVPPPTYYPLDDDEVLRLYELLADRSPVPLLLYNIPIFTKVSISPAVIGRLCAHPAIAGIKDSSRDMEYFNRVLAAVGTAGGASTPGGTSTGRGTSTGGDFEFAVFTGSDTLLLPSLDAGAAGTIAASVNLVPELAIGTRRAFAEGASEPAKARQRHLAEVVHACRCGSFPAGWKAALEEAGLCASRMVAPAAPLEPQLRGRLRRRLAELGVTSDAPVSGEGGAECG